MTAGIEALAISNRFSIVEIIFYLGSYCLHGTLLPVCYFQQVVYR